MKNVKKLFPHVPIGVLVTGRIDRPDDCPPDEPRQAFTPRRMKLVNNSRGRKTKMRKRKLGKSVLKVSPLGLGCMGLNDVYGQANEKSESIRTRSRRSGTRDYAVRHRRSLMVPSRMKNSSVKPLLPFEPGSRSLPSSALTSTLKQALAVDALTAGPNAA